jgi:AbrB family looped-hinge helix DNA binding protein
MNKSKITTKGQVTVPREVRNRLGLKTGDELEFVEENGVYRVKKILPPNQLKKYRGYLKSLSGADADIIVEEMRGK